MENQALFTPGELAFLLVLFRRNGGETCVISNRNWVHWTGLKERAKEYAIAGLREKGLEVEGRGDNATYSFSARQFGAFLTTAKPPELEKPRTKGRAVIPNPGQKIHEDCAKNGCAKLCEDCSSPGSNAQPVARTNDSKGDDQPWLESPKTRLLSLSSRASNAQPVAQTSKAGSRASSKANAQPVARSYPLTLAALKRFYATADVVFVAKLVENVHGKIGMAPDDEKLATCILPKRGQRSEGLFLYTVPLVYEKTWGVESPDSKASGSVVSFANLIRRLEAFAAFDARFDDLISKALIELKAMDNSPINDNLAKKLTSVERPFALRAIELCKGSDRFDSYEKDAKNICESMKLTTHEKQRHLEFLLESQAFEILGVPAFHL